MLPGYNTDVQHLGSTFHIQTEDNGEANPYIVTLIYQGGAIRARRKTDYRHLLGSGDRREEVRQLMNQQHREMIRMILEGKLEASSPAIAAVEEENGHPSLDASIMKFLAEIKD